MMNESKEVKFMTEHISREENLRRFRKHLRIDVALFIASMLGAFTLSGFAYLEKFHLILDVPIQRVNISAQQLLSYGATGFGSFLSALLFAMALVGIVSLFLLLIEKPRVSEERSATLPNWLSGLRDRVAENRGECIVVGVISLLAILLIFAWYLLVRGPSNNGRAAALEFASTCEDRNLTYANLDKYDGCLVAESDDMFYLLKRNQVDSKGVEFQTFALPKSGVKSITGQAQKINFKR